MDDADRRLGGARSRGDPKIRGQRCSSTALPTWAMGKWISPAATASSRASAIKVGFASISIAPGWVLWRITSAAPTVLVHSIRFTFEQPVTSLESAR